MQDPKPFLIAEVHMTDTLCSGQSRKPLALLLISASSGSSSVATWPGPNPQCRTCPPSTLQNRGGPEVGPPESRLIGPTVSLQPCFHLPTMRLVRLAHAMQYSSVPGPAPAGSSLAGRFGLGTPWLHLRTSPALENETSNFSTCQLN